jgi:hypothetical protein
VSPTVGHVGPVTIVIWSFDHDPPHVHAYEGTPNTSGARGRDLRIATGTVIDAPSPQALPAKKARQVEAWIAQNRTELLQRWHQLQP